MNNYEAKHPSRSPRSSWVLEDEATAMLPAISVSAPQNRIRASKRQLILYALIALESVCLSVAAGIIYNTKIPIPEIWSPARNTVAYNMVTSTPYFDNRSPYLGTNTTRVDSLWENLYDAGMVSVISQDEASKLLNKTRAAPKTPRLYLVQLQVFHDLHCLNLIRKWVYMDVYPDQAEWTNGKLNHDTVNALHVDHCIDALRQSIMCTGDITPRKFAPHANERQYYAYPAIYVTQMCRDYKAIQEWATERRVVEWMLSFDEEWERTRFNTSMP